MYTFQACEGDKWGPRPVFQHTNLCRSSFPAAGRLFQQSSQRTEGEISEEPRLLAAGQPAVHPPRQPGAAWMLPGDAIWTPDGPGGRVSPETICLSNHSTSCNTSTLSHSLLYVVLFTEQIMFAAYIWRMFVHSESHFSLVFPAWTWRRWKTSHLSESAVSSQCWVLLRTLFMRTPWCTTSFVCCCRSSMPAPSWQTSC